MDVIYEDDQILLVNKPCGMLSQRAEEKDDSLVEHVTAHLLEEGATHGGGAQNLPPRRVQPPGPQHQRDRHRRQDPGRGFRR